jgi:hypothetical protein
MGLPPGSNTGGIRRAPTPKSYEEVKTEYYKISRAIGEIVSSVSTEMTSLERGVAWLQYEGLMSQEGPLFEQVVTTAPQAIDRSPDTQVYKK